MGTAEARPMKPDQLAEIIRETRRKVAVALLLTREISEVERLRVMAQLDRYLPSPD